MHKKVQMKSGHGSDFNFKGNPLYTRVPPLYKDKKEGHSFKHVFIFIVIYPGAVILYAVYVTAFFAFFIVNVS